MKKSILVFMFICVLLLISCQASNGKAMVHISPDDLISDDLKVLEPHLDMYTGLVQLEYSGSKKNLKVSLERWESGRFKEIITSVSFHGEGEGYEMPISLSIKDLIDHNYRVKLIAGGAMTEEEIQLPEDEYYNVISLEEEVSYSDDQPMMIWLLKGMKKDEPLSIYHGNFQKNIETSTTALVLKLSFE